MSKTTTLRRIGVFGGTFDPPHLGHLIIAETAREQLELDRVIFVPASIPPHKAGTREATATQRHQMTKLAIQGNPSFDVSRIEIDRKSISYTIDTLVSLKEKFRTSELVLIIGSDNFSEFETWKSPREIISLATIAVYERKGFEIENARFAFNVKPIRLNGILIDLSSSALRRRVKEGKTIRYMVPLAVEKFIKSKRLYSGDSVLL